MLSRELLHHPPTSQYGVVLLNYKSIKALDYIPPKFITIEQLYLNHNRLKSLKGIEALQNLKVLHFRFNEVSQFDDLKRIKNPFFMQSLAVIGNPMQLNSKCKQEFIKEIFKNLKQFNPSFSFAKQSEIRRKNKHKYVTFKDQSPNSSQIQMQINDSQSQRTPNKTFSSIDKQKIRSNDKRYMQQSPMIVTKRFTSLYDQSTKRTYDKQHRPSIESKHSTSVPPFLSPFKSQSPPTARFKPNIEFDQNSQLTIDLIDEQNEYLAQAFHCRCLAEKCFQALYFALIQKGNKFYNQRLILKSFISLKASVSMRKIERQYFQKKEQISLSFQR